MSEPPAPAHVEPFVRVLGVDGAIAFLLEFGGAELYIATTPKGWGRLVQFLGNDKACALAAACAGRPRRVPTAKPWIATVWKSRGVAVAEIARKLHTTDVTVRSWLRKAGRCTTKGRDTDNRQLSFL